MVQFTFPAGPYLDMRKEEVEAFLRRHAQRSGTDAEKRWAAYEELNANRSIRQRISANVRVNSVFTGDVPLNLESEWAWCQRPYISLYELARKSNDIVRVLVLKPRRTGITTGAMALCDQVLQSEKGVKAIFISDSEDHAAGASEMLIYSHAHQTYMPPVKDAEGIHELGAPNFSSLTVTTAGGKSVGRSTGLKIAILDECAHYPPKKDGLAKSLKAALQGTGWRFLVEQTTANGAGGDFYEKWMASKRGENDYHRLFFPWFNHPAYRMKVNPAEEWRYRGKVPPSMAQEMIAAYDLAPERIKWWVTTVNNDFDGNEAEAAQEFPHNDIVAFMASGSPVLTAECLLTLQRSLGTIKPIFIGDIADLQEAP